MSVRAAPVARIGNPGDLKYSPAKYQAMLLNLDHSMSDIDRMVALKALEIVEKKVKSDPKYLSKSGSDRELALASIAAYFLTTHTDPLDAIRELRKHAYENKTSEKDTPLVQFGSAIRGNHDAFLQVMETDRGTFSYLKDTFVGGLNNLFKKKGAASRTTNSNNRAF